MDPNRHDEAGLTALHAAVAAGDPESVRALLARGADPNVRDLVHGATPVSLAARLGRPRVTEALREDWRSDWLRADARGLSADDHAALAGAGRTRERRAAAA